MRTAVPNRCDAQLPAAALRGCLPPAAHRTGAQQGRQRRAPHCAVQVSDVPRHQGHAGAAEREGAGGAHDHGVGCAPCAAPGGLRALSGCRPGGVHCCPHMPCCPALCLPYCLSCKNPHMRHAVAGSPHTACIRSSLKRRNQRHSAARLPPGSASPVRAQCGASQQKAASIHGQVCRACGRPTQLDARVCLCRRCALPRRLSLCRPLVPPHHLNKQAVPPAAGLRARVGVYKVEVWPRQAALPALRTAACRGTHASPRPKQQAGRWAGRAQGPTHRSSSVSSGWKAVARSDPDRTATITDSSPGANARSSGVSW